jgi:hypothetical protein
MNNTFSNTNLNNMMNMNNHTISNPKNNEMSKSKLNPKMNNYNNSSNLNRTPLQQRHVNKTNLNYESNLKSHTISKLSYLKPTKQNVNEMQNDSDNLLELNISDNNNKENDYSELLNDIEERNSQYYYNLNKKAEDSDDNYWKSSRKILLSDIEEDYDNCNYNNYSEDKKYSTPDKENSFICKAFDFFENEKFIYINKIDIKNRENINDYLAEGLFFSDI